MCVCVCVCVSAQRRLGGEGGCASYPEDVVDEQARQQQAGHLEAGQAHEGDHGHAEPHGESCEGTRDRG